jgi:hypothetical protein
MLDEGEIILAQVLGERAVVVEVYSIGDLSAELG